MTRVGDFAYDSETKRQRSEWVGEHSPQPKKLRFQKSKVKKVKKRENRRGTGISAHGRPSATKPKKRMDIRSAQRGQHDRSNAHPRLPDMGTSPTITPREL